MVGSWGDYMGRCLWSGLPEQWPLAGDCLFSTTQLGGVPDVHVTVHGNDSARARSGEHSLDLQVTEGRTRTFQRTQDFVVEHNRKSGVLLPRTSLLYKATTRRPLFDTRRATACPHTVPGNQSLGLVGKVTLLLPQLHHETRCYISVPSSL